MRRESVRVEKDILIREDGILLTHSIIRARAHPPLHSIIRIVRHLP